MKDSRASSWSGVVLSAERFDAFLEARGHRPPYADALHFDDLYLACACLERDPAALEHFEKAVLSKLTGAIHTFDDPQEVLQRVRERLLIGPSGAPKLAEYKGQGSLLKWAQVVAMRVALSMAKAAPDEEPIDRLLERPAPGDPPELAILKRQHSKDFAHAFTAAVAALDPREKNLLRLSIVDRVSAEALGVLYGVHKSSAARWVAAAREKLVLETRRSLAAKLKLSDSQVDSLIGAVQSQVEVSINRLLKE